MPVVSITRLRLRAWRFLPSFFLYSFRSARQAERTPGFVGGWLGGSGGNAYWTVTAWRDDASMKTFRDRNEHKAAMPKLLNWCDEASVARLEQTGTDVPDGEAVFQTLSRGGRTSKVRHPTAEHSAGRTVPDGRVPRVGRRLAPAAV